MAPIALLFYYVYVKVKPECILYQFRLQIDAFNNNVLTNVAYRAFRFESISNICMFINSLLRNTQEYISESIALCLIIF